MELSCSRETVLVNEPLYDGVLEQSIEIDHLLPDYCSSIFKILRCRTSPHLISATVQNGRLFIEGVGRIEILYTAEETFTVCSVTQKQRFSKTLDLKDAPQKGSVRADIRCDYLNCRAVSPRRTALRGALLIHAVVTVQKEHSLLTAAKGCGIQTDTVPLTVLSGQLSSRQEFTVREEIPLSYGKPAVGAVLSFEASAALTECRVIANRAITKGEVTAHLLYTPAEGGKPEIMEHAFPISQVLDIPGITEEWSVLVQFDVSDIEPVLRDDAANGEAALAAVFTVNALCEAKRNTETTCIRDAYSTCCEAHPVLTSLRTARLLHPIRETRTCRCTVTVPQEELIAVYDIRAQFLPGECRLTNGAIRISGSLHTTVLACSSENLPVSIEQKHDCEVTLDAPDDIGALSFTPHIAVRAVSYRLAAAGEVEITAELLISGFLCGETACMAASEITADTKNKPDRSDDPAIRLCYAAAGERLWDIAKHYRTDLHAVLAENETVCDPLAAACVLLIPTPPAVQEE